MRVRFWGTRGSIAAPGPATVRYGGNTACVEVRDAAGRLLVLDAGTGLRELGRSLVRTSRGPWDVDVVLSHLHWDHLQGLPFFRPALDASSHLRLHAPAQERPLREVLRGGMGAAFFPADLDGLPAAFDVREVEPGAALAIGPFAVRSAALAHPGGALAYRIAADGASVVYATDTEVTAGPGPDALVELAAGADLLIHDAQYLPDDFRPGWGHSTVQAAIDVAVRARVRTVVLTHHDPDRSDDALDAIALLARRYARERAPSLEVVVAADGLALEVGPPR